MSQPRFPATCLLATVMLVAATPFVSAQTNSCGGDNGGITLPPGFCATIFADNLGHARQMVFGPGGVLYLNTWSGGYYQNDKPPDGGFLVALKNTKGDGRADAIERLVMVLRRAQRAVPAFVSIMAVCSPSRTTRSSVIRCRPMALCQGSSRTSLFPACRLPVIIRCTRSSSMRKATCSSISARRPIRPETKSYRQFAGLPALHRVTDPCRHLAVRCQQRGSAFLAEGTLCDWAA